MAAAEKFKAPEPSSAGGDMPNIVTEPTIQEESDEEEVCNNNNKSRYNPFRSA